MAMSSRQQNGSWYSAHLIFKSQVGDALELDPLCEDRVVLLYASDERAARIAAVKYGEGQNIAYRNENGELVDWHFVGVEQLEEVGSERIGAGWEVAARLFRPSDLGRARAAEDRLSESRRQGPRREM
jgi:hypothetical protein